MGQLESFHKTRQNPTSFLRLGTGQLGVASGELKRIGYVFGEAFERVFYSKTLHRVDDLLSLGKCPSQSTKNIEPTGALIMCS